MAGAHNRVHTHDRTSMVTSRIENPVTSAIMPSTSRLPQTRLADKAGVVSHALEAAEIGPWHWDLTSGTISLSRHAAALLGCTTVVPATYAGFLGLVHPDDRIFADT